MPFLTIHSPVDDWCYTLKLPYKDVVVHHMCFLPVEFDPQLLMPKSHSGHTFPSLKERKLYLYLLFLQKLSVMVNVTKGILVECDPAMKQVFTSLRA